MELPAWIFLSLKVKDGTSQSWKQVKKAINWNPKIKTRQGQSQLKAYRGEK